jgi:ferric iron reductase protein FhuF
LVSPWLGTAVRAGAVPVVPASSLWFLPSAQPVRLAVVGPVQWVEASVATLYDACLGPLVEPLLAATASAYSVSSQVMWGNVASSVVGAGTVLRQSTDLGQVDAWVRGLLATGELSGCGDLTRTGFVRNSCCLMYRIPGAGLCGDCVLRTR